MLNLHQLILSFIVIVCVDVALNVFVPSVCNYIYGLMLKHSSLLTITVNHSLYFSFSFFALLNVFLSFLTLNDDVHSVLEED